VPADLTRVKAIAVGVGHTVALLEDGKVRAWGDNKDGQCNVPADLTRVKAIAVGVGHTVALLEDGKVRAWGNNKDGQCNVPAELAASRPWWQRLFGR
jgi:alpha-tubulin suppressor-like RCC1 family protein